jgi:hypothetical protein
MTSDQAKLVGMGVLWLAVGAVLIGAKKLKRSNPYMGFSVLKAKVARRGGVYSPGGIAATAGRAKYGTEGMKKLAALGRQLKRRGYTRRRTDELKKKLAERLLKGK